MNQDSFYNDDNHYLHTSSSNNLTMSTGDVSRNPPHDTTVNASTAAAKAALQYPTPNNDSINVNTNHPYQPQQQQYQQQQQQQQQQQGNPITNFFSKSGHPITCIFHIFFKVAAILIYLMGGVFEKSTNFVTVTVLCVISLSMDFWTVKNITGRLLVGLRWWANEEVVPLQSQPPSQTYPIPSSTTKWIFESKPNYKPNAFDQWWFWTVLYTNSIIWIVFFFSSLLKWNFGWLLVDGLGIALAFANVYGYWQCSKEQKIKFDNTLKQQLEKGVTAGANYSLSSGMIGSWMNSVWNKGTSTSSTQPTHSFV